jgi:3-phenylpropionate/trans-cinnamate dioxygenase ferredoxin reductase component
MSSSDTFVIVGAGMAGGKAAETLREEGFDGRVVLLGAEPHRPYERPPLSKDYLRGEAEQPAWLQEDEGWYAANRVELRTSSVVQSIDAGDKAVVLGGGERIDYDRLLLATGGEPRALPVPGGDLEGVHLLRTIEDSNRIRALFDGGGRLVVIGGGWIGCEVAASAKQKGMDVTVIESLELPLLRVLGPELGGFYRGVHEDQGVEMLLGAGVEAIEGSGRAERVRLSDGKTIDCAAVVVGIGVAPRTELVDGIARVDNGVVVDERLQSSADGIFACGDIANAAHPVFTEHVRVEHWANALEQGPAAARSMLGKDVSYDKVPYFFSDQYDVGMEYAGLHDPNADELVVRGDMGSREFVAFWVRGDRLMAGMNVNVWDVSDPIQELVRSRATVDRARLADPDVPVAEVASPAAAG